MGLLSQVIKSATPGAGVSALRARDIVLATLDAAATKGQSVARRSTLTDEAFAAGIDPDTMKVQRTYLNKGLKSIKPEELPTVSKALADEIGVSHDDFLRYMGIDRQALHQGGRPANSGQPINWNAFLDEAERIRELVPRGHASPISSDEAAKLTGFDGGGSFRVQKTKAINTPGYVDEETQRRLREVRTKSGPYGGYYAVPGAIGAGWAANEHRPRGLMSV